MIYCPTLIYSDDEDDSPDCQEIVEDLAATGWPTICITVEGENTNYYNDCAYYLKKCGYDLVHEDINQNTLENTLKFWYKDGDKKYPYNSRDNCNCCGFINYGYIKTLEIFVESFSNQLPFHQVILIHKDVFNYLENVPFVKKIVELKAVDDLYVLFQFDKPENYKNMSMNDRQTYIVSGIQQYNKDMVIYENLKEHRGLVVGKKYKLSLNKAYYNSAKIKGIERFCDVVKFRIDSLGYYGNVSEYSINVRDTQDVTFKEVN